MITKLENETAKQYQAICDYWNLGPGRSLNQLFEQYKKRSNPASKTYGTIRKWAQVNNWESRIAENIADEQKLIEEMYREELIKNSKQRYEILGDMFELSQQMLVNADNVSVAQATTLYKTYLDATGKVFDLDVPDKIALTDPTGKKQYNGVDVNELLKLADAAKRRPD